MTGRNDKGEFAGKVFSVTLFTLLCFEWTFFAGPVTAGRSRPNKG
jgi:hypothetical protein